MKTMFLICLACLGLAGPAVAQAGTKPPPVLGGTAVVGVENAPPCLDPLASSCNTLATDWMTESTLLGAYRVLPDLTYEPVLVDRVDLVRHPTAKRAFTVTYHIKPEAVWSDGVPVGADDFIFTLDAIRNPANDVATRTGYDGIVEAAKLDAKTVRFEFDRPYAAWKTLFSTVLPQHVLAGTDFNSSFMDGIAVGDGPYLVTSFTAGQQLTLSRNPLWWGAHAPYLDSVTFRFPLDLASETASVASGAVDLIVPSASSVLEPLLNTPGVTFTQMPGLFQEHLEFHVASTTQPLLGQAWFRQAVASAIDRTALAQAVWGTLVPTIEPLQSLVTFAQQPGYAPDFAGYVYDPAKVAALMTAHGCVRGGDGIWSCNGVRTSIGITVNTFQATRLFEESMLQAQAAAAGIELVTQNLPPWVIFGPNGVPGGLYDSAIFAWVTDPDPAGMVDLYRCGGVSNFMGYCSQPVTDLLDASLVELNAKQRLDDLQQADALLAQDVPSIPLYQRPQFVAYRSTLHGVVNNASTAGPFWNLADWWRG